MSSLRPASAKLLERRHWVLLALLGVANFFDGYDRYIVTVALPQIRETFGLSQSQASVWLAFLFLGALPAVPLTRLADTRGRRRLLLVSIVGYTLATAATAVTPSIGWFVTAQFVARLFLNVEHAVSWTMIAEELPAGARGFGFGWLSMLAAIGSGLAALVYGVALEPAGISWRWLYVAAIPPLVGLTALRRALPESGRFESARLDGRLAHRWHEIARRPHRRWLVLVSLAAALGALVTQAEVFFIDFLQTDRGLSASASNLILVAAGGMAVPMLVVSGSLSDRVGRKIVGCGFGLLAIVGGASFFFLAHTPFPLFLALAVTFVGQFGSGPALAAFGMELFPTRLRAFAGSAHALARVGGQFFSFIAGSALITATGNVPRAALVLSAGPLLMILVVAVFFPETHRRELEDIAP